MNSFFLTILFVLLHFVICGQSDTLYWHEYNVNSVQKGKYIYYFHNGKSVSKAVYDSITTIRKAETQQFINCKPCYVKRYTTEGKLHYEGLQYQDCPVGIYTEYYPDGKIKEKGNYAPFELKRQCALRNGTFYFYSKEGALVKEEVWDLGKLISEK